MRSWQLMVRLLVNFDAAGCVCMDIGVPLRELGEYDIAPLRDVILAQGEDVWLGNTYRQQE